MSPAMLLFFKSLSNEQGQYLHIPTGLKHWTSLQHTDAELIACQYKSHGFTKAYTFIQGVGWVEPYSTVVSKTYQ